MSQGQKSLIEHTIEVVEVEGTRIHLSHLRKPDSSILADAKTTINAMAKSLKEAHVTWLEPSQDLLTYANYAPSAEEHNGIFNRLNRVMVTIDLESFNVSIDDFTEAATHHPDFLTLVGYPLSFIYHPADEDFDLPIKPWCYISVSAEQMAATGYLKDARRPISIDWYGPNAKCVGDPFFTPMVNTQQAAHLTLTLPARATVEASAVSQPTSPIEATASICDVPTTLPTSHAAVMTPCFPRGDYSATDRALPSVKEEEDAEAEAFMSHESAAGIPPLNAPTGTQLLQVQPTATSKTTTPRAASTMLAQVKTPKQTTPAALAKHVSSIVNRTPRAAAVLLAKALTPHPEAAIPSSTGSSSQTIPEQIVPEVTTTSWWCCHVKPAIQNGSNSGAKVK